MATLKIPKADMNFDFFVQNIDGEERFHINDYKMRETTHISKIRKSQEHSQKRKENQSYDFRNLLILTFQISKFRFFNLKYRLFNLGNVFNPDCPCFRLFILHTN